MITWARKVLEKHQHLETVQAKIDIMQHQVKMFIGLCKPLFQKGLPSFWEENGKLLSQVEYHAQLVKCKLDHRKVEDMQQSLSRKTIVEKLSEDFEIINAFRATCAQFPPISYTDHVELRVPAKEMASLEFPISDQWKTVEKFGKTKYRLHQ